MMISLVHNVEHSIAYREELHLYKQLEYKVQFLVLCVIRDCN